MQFAKQKSYVSISDSTELDSLKKRRTLEQEEKKELAASAPPPAKKIKKGTPDAFAPPNKILFLQNLPEGAGASSTLTDMFSQFEVCAFCR